MTQIDLPLLLKACADPIRLLILRLLKRDSLAASELAVVLEIKQSTLSHHLKIMTQAHWLSTRREGNTLFYRRHVSSQAEFAVIQRSILQNLDTQQLSAQHAQELLAIRGARQQISAAFFESHAQQLDSVTDRIAGYKHYADALQDALNRCALNDLHTALEIGPGDGGFLPYLSKQFKKVYALDIAEPMLELARLQVKNLSNIEFIHGNLDQLIQQNQHTDFVALNMVLHHIASPEDFLAQCWQVLNPNGMLLITDLCSHQQAWVRENCGDFWMGFEPDELLNWAKNLGFSPQEPVLVGLKNGFQVQIHIFKKQAANAVVAVQ